MIRAGSLWLISYAYGNPPQAAGLRHIRQSSLVQCSPLIGATDDTSIWISFEFLFVAKDALAIYDTLPVRGVTTVTVIYYRFRIL